MGQEKPQACPCDRRRVLGDDSQIHGSCSAGRAHREAELGRPAPPLKSMQKTEGRTRWRRPHWTPAMCPEDPQVAGTHQGPPGMRPQCCRPRMQDEGSWFLTLCVLTARNH